MPPILTGCLAPVPSPISNKGGYEMGALTKHLHWLEKEGASGALVLGTNGEFASLNVQEKMSAAVEASGSRGNLKLILGVSSCALAEVKELLKWAEKQKFDAVLCAPPWYFREAPPAGVAAFFKAVLDASHLPVILYHIPQLTGIAISDALLELIGAHENLAGVKDSSGDEAELKRLSDRFKDKTYFVGNDTLVAAAYKAGAAGSISACANVVPDLVSAVAKAPEQQAKLNSVRSLLEKFGLQGSTKSILRKLGLGEYATRPPLVPLSEKQEGELMQMLTLLGVVKGLK